MFDLFNLAIEWVKALRSAGNPMAALAVGVAAAGRAAAEAELESLQDLGTLGTDLATEGLFGVAEAVGTEIEERRKRAAEVTAVARQTAQRDRAAAEVGARKAAAAEVGARKAAEAEAAAAAEAEARKAAERRDLGARTDAEPARKPAPVAKVPLAPLPTVSAASSRPTVVEARGPQRDMQKLRGAYLAEKERYSSSAGSSTSPNWVQEAEKSPPHFTFPNPEEANKFFKAQSEQNKFLAIDVIGDEPTGSYKISIPPVIW